jgi:cbb3-type cytochrome oxidase subunit 3
MDINVVRIVVTIVAMTAFFGIVWWAYAPGRKRALDRIAESILERDDA